MNYRHVSCNVVTLPPVGVDPAVDRAVIAGQLRRVHNVTLPDGKAARVGVTKGVTFVHVCAYGPLRGRVAARFKALVERRAR